MFNFRSQLLQSAGQYGAHPVKHVCIIWHHLRTENTAAKFLYTSGKSPRHISISDLFELVT